MGTTKDEDACRWMAGVFLLAHFLSFMRLSFLPNKTELYKHHIHMKQHIKERQANFGFSEH